MDSYEELASLFNTAVVPTPEGFRTDCPYCGRQGKLYINTDKRVGCCFHEGCAWHVGKGGVTAYRLKALLKKEGIRYTTAPTVVTFRGEHVEPNLPVEFKVLDEIEDESLRNSIYAYLNSRGLHTKTLRRQKVGYAEHGKYWGYIVFPVFNSEGSVIYWQGRRFKNRQQKFFNPPCSNKKEIWYQIGGSTQTKRLIIVESVINALTLDGGTRLSRTAIIALLGKTMSEHQLDHIRSYDRYLRDVVVALDPDAISDALNMAKKLASCGLLVRVAELPAGEDINSIGRAKAWTAIFEAKPYREINVPAQIENFSSLGRK